MAEDDVRRVKTIKPAVSGLYGGCSVESRGLFEIVQRRAAIGQFPPFERPRSVLDIPGFLTSFLLRLPLVLSTTGIALDIGRSTILFRLTRILARFLPDIARGTTCLGSFGGRPRYPVGHQKKNHGYPTKRPVRSHNLISRSSMSNSKYS
ncbi:hypothetical protein [Pseudomonas fluorescens]|uniref:hypothetical protein n=1 Tax=Pseudomonas fluorescens TaxID=294 RepID=UPI0017839D09|nr:hypothetical protein [Pseudomonas fluorescens]